MLREFNQKDSNIATLSTFFAVMLNAAQKSLSHNFAALARFSSYTSSALSCSLMFLSLITYLK